MVFLAFIQVLLVSCVQFLHGSVLWFDQERRAKKQQEQFIRYADMIKKAQVSNIRSRAYWRSYVEGHLIFILANEVPNYSRSSTLFWKGISWKQDWLLVGASCKHWTSKWVCILGLGSSLWTGKRRPRLSLGLANWKCILVYKIHAYYFKF